ncbi:MAG: hypothetical protein V3R54_08520, partial [Thermodesulfovibrionia bacterium]
RIFFIQELSINKKIKYQILNIKIMVKIMSLLQKSLFVIPEVFIGNPATVGYPTWCPIFFKIKDFWIPAYRRQARWSLSRTPIRGEYDNNSDSLDIFTRDLN